MDKLLSQKTGIKAFIAENAEESVVYGTGKALDNLNLISDGTLNIQRNKML
jgi:actin-like ATPase involved in cell morphogenesis